MTPEEFAAQTGLSLEEAEMVLLARLKKAAESRPLSVRLEAAFQALNRAQEKVGVKPYEESK